MGQLVKRLAPLATFYLRKLQKHLAILVIPVWTPYSWLLGQLSVTASSVITVLSNSSLGDSPNISSLMSAISSLGISSSSSISLPAVSTISLEMLSGIPSFQPFTYFLPLLFLQDIFASYWNLDMHYFWQIY